MYKFFNGNLSGQYFKPSLTVRLLKLRKASPFERKKTVNWHVELHVLYTAAYNTSTAFKLFFMIFRFYCAMLCITRTLRRCKMSPSVCPSVRPSHAGIHGYTYPKTFYTIGPHHFSFCIPNSVAIFRRDPLTGASNTREYETRSLAVAERPRDASCHRITQGR